MPSEAEIDALIERLRDVAGFVQKEHGRVAAASCLATEAAAFLAALSEERDRRDVQAFDAATAHGKTKLALQKAEARVRELEQRLERAREALEPFAQIDMSRTDDIGDDALVLENDGRNLVLGDLRRARATLAEIGHRE